MHTLYMHMFACEVKSLYGYGHGCSVCAEVFLHLFARLSWDLLLNADGGFNMGSNLHASMHAHQSCICPYACIASAFCVHVAYPCMQ